MRRAGIRVTTLVAGAWILLIAALGVTLSLQGWRSRAPGTDVIPYIDSAHALLSHGRIPDRGVITSLGSYAPPGLTWVVLPGISLSPDPRIADVPGMVMLHLGTLIGVFLLARACFGVPAAFLSVLLYGLSERGLMFASSLAVLGPRGHPFFYVWMTYWIYWWVTRRDARYLAAACMTWVVGMWLFMEIAPAALIVPVVWMIYRPPVRLRPLLLVAAVGLVIWLPHLRFESARSFADVRSQLLMQNITPPFYSDALCDSTLRLRQLDGTLIQTASTSLEPTPPTTSVVVELGGHLLAAARGLIGNFGVLVPGANFALLALTLAGLVIVGVFTDAARFGVRGRAARSFVSASWPTAVAIALLVWAVAANEAVVSRVLGSWLRLGPFAITSIRVLQRLAALAGVAILARRAIARLLTRLSTRLDAETPAQLVFVVALVVPWVTLLLVTEPGREDRLLFLWPLQVIVLSFVAVTLSAGFDRAARVAGWLIPSLVALLILFNPLAVSSVEGWRRDGWSGLDSVENRIADYLAQRLHSEGRTDAAIGYRIFADGPPTPPWKMADERLKAGAEIDLLLEYSRGISNLNQCVEGLSARDEYRIVEVSPPSVYAAYHFDVPVSGHLRLLDRIGGYDVYHRE